MDQINIQNPQNIPEMIEKISKYKILGELGKGGMGCVYKAFDPDMDKPIALKVILANKTGETEVQRFIREAKAMAKISHPNIVKIYTIGEEVSCPYFTMDYIEGVSLKEFLENTPLNIRLFSQIMLKIAAAVAYVHQRGIIHRDLKPGNILLDKNGEPYVMDFGLVKLIEAENSLSVEGALMGTPQYMSPQQALGEKVNHLSDVYALGAMFYEMLAGQPLVEALSVINILHKVVNEEPVLLRQVNKKIAVDLETICHKAVAKELERRYQSVQEFSEDIERFLHGELIKAKAAGKWQRIRNKLRKNKLAMIAAIAGCLAITLGISLFKSYQNVDVYKHLSRAKKLQQKAKDEKNIEKQMQTYLEINNYLEKALDLSLNNFELKKQLIKTKQKIGMLAKEQKNYLLSFALFKQCKNLGYKQAHTLLQELEHEKNQLQKDHTIFISKAMKEISKEAPPELFDRYVFAIVKMQRSYVVKILVPYLQKDNKNQRLLAIKALGKFGNKHTKFKGKDSVEWLLNHLRKFKDRKSIEANQKEVEEIIWALGWLKDGRANVSVYKIRVFARENSVLWMKTTTPYRWIPLGKKPIKNVDELFVQGNMRQDKNDHAGAVADFSEVIALRPKNATAYSNRGASYRFLKKYQKAIADLTQAIALNPKNSDAYNNRGIIYTGMKKYQKSMADLTQAIALNPKNAITYNNRGNVYEFIQEYDKAISDYSTAIALDPKNVLAYMNRGLLYQKIKKYKLGVIDHKKAIALNPKNSFAYSSRGSIYFDIKEYDKALDDHTKAITLNPKNSITYSNRANVYRDIKEYKKSLADFNQAIVLDPKDPIIYSNRASVYRDIKAYDKAIADYSKAIVLNPKEAFAYHNRADVYQRLRAYHKAIADYDKAIALSPKNTFFYRHRGVIYSHIKKFYQAIADFNKAIALNSKDVFAYYNRGLVYEKMRKYRLAIADYSKTIALNPKYSSAYNNRGVVYQALREYNKAMADYTKTIALNPKNSVAYYNKGVIYQNTNNPYKAIANYDKAIALNPRYSSAYINRGIVYLSSNQHQKAYRDFRKLLKLAPRHPSAPKIFRVVKDLEAKNLVNKWE